jgi:protein-L-isoaspartate(D-aspartate) O-methyltransferase
MSAPQDLVAVARDHGVRDERVLAAVSSVARADFVPGTHTALAYRDQPIPISHQQVTTQPSLCARMLEALRLRGDDRVLEIGTGYGYQAALLAALAAEVVSVEWWPDMVEQARDNLAANGIGNVTVITGDGGLGAASSAPFDGIVVAAAYPEVPRPLVEQLRVGGRLVQPIGAGGDEIVVVFQRTAEGLVRRAELVPARFVMLRGKHGYPAPGG